MAESGGDRLMTSAEAAARVGATVQTLAKWRHLGHGPAYVKASRRFVRYRQADLDAWVAAHHEVPTRP
jgi:predicted DNA-binding transcriptional regulator AlpA